MMKHLIAIALFSILITNDVLLGQNSPLKDLYNQSKISYEAEDYVAFLQLTEKALEIHPSQPTLLYNKALGMVLTDEFGGAISALKYLLSWNIDLPIQKDSIFSVCLDEATVADLQEWMGTYKKKVTEGDAVFTLSGKYHLEDLEIVDNMLCVTDVHRGSLLIIDLETMEIDSEIALAGSGMALVYHPVKHTLWVSSAMIPQYADYKEEKGNEGYLYEYDLKEQKVINQLHLPGPAVIGNMVIKDEFLYASNSASPEIWVINSENLSIIDQIDIEDGYSLQGIAIDSINNCLFVADYIRGIARIDLSDGNKYEWLHSSEYLLKGIDGLTWMDSNTIRVIQNNSTPRRVVDLSIDRDDNVTDVKLVENGIFEKGEPTNGKNKTGSGFYYISNSPWPFYDQDNNPNQDKWPLPQIRKIKN